MTQTIGSLVTVTAGLFFSVVVALLLEELAFGALFRVFFGGKKKT